MLNKGLTKSDFDIIRVCGIKTTKQFLNTLEI